MIRPLLHALGLGVTLLLIGLPGKATAQVTASLVADAVQIDAAGRLVASGNVQAFYAGAVLSAQSIAYDPAADRLRITGPIFIRTAEGDVFAADEAALDPTFRNGILRGARIVLDQQLQIAANQISRVEDGRYSALTRAVASSCQVCGDRPPLWEIRAESVIHDTEDRQLYFENATFHIRGAPLLWVPRMRLPDPTLDRSAGLLIPRLTSNDLLGIGIRLPYFLPIGQSRDLLLTPFIASETLTLEARYRQAFLQGGISVEGAISSDTIREGDLRWYLFSDSAFELGRDFELRFRGESVSDPGVLLDYGVSEKDRLANRLSLQQIREDSLLQAEGTIYESLRPDESDATLPPVVLSFGYEARRTPPGLGGVFTYGVSADAALRSIGANADESRDVARAGGSINWQRNAILGPGIVLDAEADLRLDYYNVQDDPEEGEGFRVGPAAAVTLRWPFVRAGGADRAAHVIEPVVSIGWSESYGFAPPNEDATLAELDEGNLWALTRFPGEDAREVGWRANAGVSWTRIGPQGGQQVLTFGRIYQSRAQPDFSPASGQQDAFSDWMLSAKLDIPGGFSFDARTLFNDRFTFNKTEAHLGWHNSWIDLDAGYVWLPADPTRERDTVASEWNADVKLQVTDHWSIRSQARYDISVDEWASAGFGVGYINECVTVDLSVARRYTSNEAVDPATEFGLSIKLTGFSAGRSTPGPARTCRSGS